MVSGTQYVGEDCCNRYRQVVLRSYYVKEFEGDATCDSPDPGNEGHCPVNFSFRPSNDRPSLRLQETWVLSTQYSLPVGERPNQRRWVVLFTRATFVNSAPQALPLEPYGIPKGRNELLRSQVRHQMPPATLLTDDNLVSSK